MTHPHPDFGLLPPRIETLPPGPRTRALLERLGRVESRNVTWVDERFPVVWSEAVGANVRDPDGNVYLDWTAAFGVALAGHAHPAIAAVVGRAAERFVHGMGDVHPPEPKILLLERLAELSPWSGGTESPGLGDSAARSETEVTGREAGGGVPGTRSVLANSGSEAVEIALKTALLATGRPGILAFEGGYHGLTLGALAATARPDFRRPFSDRLYGGVAFAPWPARESGEPHADRAHTAEAALEAVRQALQDGTPSGAPIGAVIVEPVQGRAGVRIPPDGFLAAVVELARAAGAVVIFDEVFTGFGRTGKHFAHQWESAPDGAGEPAGRSVVPDLLCVGKALGGGLPLSACLGRADVMDAWPESTGEALHTSTFLGHPLSCHAALAFLDLLETEDLAGRALGVGTTLMEAVEGRLGGRPGVVSIRGRGAMIGVEFEHPDGDAHGLRPPGVAVAEAALRRGLLLLPAGADGSVVEITPPVMLSEGQVEAGVEALAGAVGEALGGGAA